MSATSPIGRDLLRPEGMAKVRGEALYTADVVVPGAWVGGVVRSPLPRGRLHGWERDPGFDFGRVAVVIAQDIPGDNVQALIVDDQPILVEREIRHCGEALALVAAPDRELLATALAALRPRLEELTPVLDFEQSTEVQKEVAIDKGDVDAVMAAATRIIENTYRTDSQEQLYIEPQAMIAWPADETGRVMVGGSLQCPHYVQKALARALALPPERCRVVQYTTGGGFGGKEDYPSVVACHAALLARQSGRPVRILYDRHEDLANTPKRHPSRVRHRTAVAPDGRLLAMDIEVLLDGGAYTTLSPVVLSRASIHAAGAYSCENVRIRGRVVATHHVPYGAFRGFGAPQVCFAIERHMDRIARELGIHPYELRLRNALRAGSTTATGQVLDESCASSEVLDGIAAATRIDRHPWGRARARATGDRVRRGRGMSFFFHGAGFTGSGEELLKGRVRVELQPSGRVEVFTGSTEIGQGSRTMFTAIAAAALGADPGDVVLAEPDTASVPDSGPTVASRTCMIVGGCVDRACRELAARISAGQSADRPFPERVRAFVANGGDAATTVTYASPPGLRWDEDNYRGDAYPTYGWAADVADVEVDLDTFEVRVVDFTTVVDVGKAIQPQIVRGQIEGGSLQAIGWAHREYVSARNGRFEQQHLATCIIPTALDAPPMRVELVEKPFANGPFGAKGVGELPMDGGAPAVAAAIEDAVGVAVDRLPATPERLLAAWLASHPAESYPSETP